MLQRRFRPIIIAVIAGLAAAVWYFGGPFQNRRIPILMYHDVGQAGSDMWTVSPEDFESQMNQLSESGYKTILPSDLLAYAHRRKALPKKPVILTFDDGLLSLKEIVAPTLKKHGFRAVAYLVTSATADSTAERKSVDGNPCLTWPEVRELHQDGTLVFGGHTAHHDLSLYAQHTAAEIELCYHDILTKGGFKPDSFCFPYNEGAGDKSVEEMVRKAGFTTAVTCEEKQAKIRRRSNMFHLPRLWVRGGRHVFSVDQLPWATEVGGSGLTLRVSQEGFPIPVTPRFTWPGMPVDGGWLPALTLDPTSGKPVLSSSTALAPPGAQGVRFELWDTNRFFRLCAWPEARPGVL